MDLLYTKLLTDEGELQVPNAGLLASAIGPRPPRNADAAEPTRGDYVEQSPSAAVRTQELPIAQLHPAQRMSAGAGTRRPS